MYVYAGMHRQLYLSKYNAVLATEELPGGTNKSEHFKRVSKCV